MSGFLFASGWRFVPIRHGDTLQEIAARELGDAARWHDLIALNDLIPPYITGDPEIATSAAGRVLLYGQQLRVFAPSAQADASTDPEALYGIDIALEPDGTLAVDSGGDFATVAGLPNLYASLARRVTTERGELLFHQSYGSMVRQVLGKASTASRGALAARSARIALEQDDRVARVHSVTATTAGDRLLIAATVEPIGSGETITIRAET